MRKKIIIIAALGVILIGIITVLLLNISKEKCINTSKSQITEKLNLISDFVNKYEVKTSGKVSVSANYKGAHGENYPAEFIYNYDYTDKLYFEDTKYSYLELNSDLFHIIKVLAKIKDIDVSKYDSLKRTNGGYLITYDREYINGVLGTNFKSIKVVIKLEGLVKKVQTTKINLDDITINIDNDDIKIKYKNNDIDLKIGEEAYYININDKLKMNIFIKDSYTFSIVLNNQVYSLEMKDEGLFIKFNSSAAIYNNITLNVSYDDVTLEKIDEDLNDNPIIRYLSESDLSVWR